MLGHLILASFRVVGACTLCPCVIVPGENLADPATLVPRAREEATAIFAGQVVRIDTVETTPSPFPPDTVSRRGRPRVISRLRYVLSVEHVWKGDVARRVDVVAQTLRSSCGTELSLNERYLVYAAGPLDSLAADGCARVVPGVHVSDGELRALGPGFDLGGPDGRAA
jgi:hypothetical protein